MFFVQRDLGGHVERHRDRVHTPILRGAASNTPKQPSAPLAGGFQTKARAHSVVNPPSCGLHPSQRWISDTLARWKCLEPTAEAARAPGPTAEAARAPGPTAEAARSLVPAMHARPPLT